MKNEIQYIRNQLNMLEGLAHGMDVCKDAPHVSRRQAYMLSRIDNIRRNLKVIESSASACTEEKQ